MHMHMHMRARTHTHTHTHMHPSNHHPSTHPSIHLYTQARARARCASDALARPLPYAPRPLRASLVLVTAARGEHGCNWPRFFPFSTCTFSDSDPGSGAAGPGPKTAPLSTLVAQPQMRVGLASHDDGFHIWLCVWVRACVCVSPCICV